MTSAWVFLAWFLGGLAIAWWARGFQVRYLLDALDRVTIDLKRAVEDIARLEQANREVVENVQQQLRGRDAPAPDQLRLLLDRLRKPPTPRREAPPADGGVGGVDAPQQ